MSFSFWPRVVFRTKSRISGEIVVKEHLGKYSLHVQGLIQSGGIVKGIWKKPIRAVQRKMSVARQILVLGLGGGTVVQLIKARWPEAKIIGIEIDPEIIRVGKKYFGLGKVTGLKTVQANAFSYVAKAHGEFDLVIVDLYLGHQLPRAVASDKFLGNVARLVADDGVAVFNCLRGDEKSLSDFERKLKKHFASTARIKTSTNLFFLARV